MQLEKNISQIIQSLSNLTPLLHKEFGIWKILMLTPQIENCVEGEVTFGDYKLCQIFEMMICSLTLEDEVTLHLFSLFFIDCS